MMKFVIPFAIAVLAPVYGAQAEPTNGKAAATTCHPEWSKGHACRTQKQSSNVGSAVGACHPEWSKGHACAARVAAAARESKAQAAKAAHLVSVANSN